MPGVTVEASSPALIEQVRSAVTDGAGRYAIIDLRPGTYTVTFTLPGFRLGEARRDRARGRVRGAGQRIAGGRRGRGNGDRHRRVADRRHAEHAEPGGAQPSGARRAARGAHDAGRRGAGAGRQLLQPGVRQHDVDPRIGDRRPAHLLRRDEHRSEPDRHRQPGQRRHRQRAGADRAGLRRRIAVGRERARRRAHGLDPEGRRQQLLRRVAHARLERIAAERQHHRRAAAVHLRQHAARLQLRHQPGVRRPDQEEQAVVPARPARVAHQQPDRLPGRRPAGVSQRHPGRVGRLHRPARNGAADVAGVAAQQDRRGRSTSRRPARSASTSAAARPAATSPPVFRPKRRTRCRSRCSTPAR